MPLWGTNDRILINEILKTGSRFVGGYIMMVFYFVRVEREEHIPAMRRKIYCPEIS